ncbi:AraC family transcriptional regulator [Mycolicibacter heraklionensis]|uniref:helix-turn-helix transcriptional regulator n=1 Tax=Mycolicibacter heraklionensis TaxID=512402 RepID=UPI00061AF467|nr:MULTISPECIES: AraC family transcriptional regulator [Mycobacteriaceae]OBG37083.1 AraC family transcriptional regulator [Mycolicibacter heraklionensis]
MLPTARLVRQRAGVKVYDYPTAPHLPPVVVARVGRERLSQHGQIHNFPALWCDRSTGMVYVVAMGATVGPEAVECADDGIAVFFDPAAVGHDGASPWLSWRSHPLLCLFLHENEDGLLRIELPVADRPAIFNILNAMKSELTQRQDGDREAISALLTLLLVKLTRLGADTIDSVRHEDEPLLAEVFATIDRRYTEPLSLREVAREVSVSAGHLTTVVRRRTGRTVLEWITQRRMGEARRLLTDTRLSITEIGQRVGLPDAAYFTRQFRQTHGVSPSQWRKSPPPPL